ncbi:MarR family transcriptional regulator [Paratractidigestivibacter sp.]|uniref:MarR family transcriptional regulator n=1 Tax=Paratractidigestivibacter sp. TaxID=2847316 RepID=UPI002ABD6F02|nr:MarR family transcriptional regulator [Paratractidigestivibacter sp.]
MDLREYMSVRRAYNIVRQSIDSKKRLTFEEFAILCRLDAANEPVKTSAIAEYQSALRPTMTHRTNHLAGLAYIVRGEGEKDRRNVVCSISDAGREAVAELSTLTRAQIPSGAALSRTSPERICKYVDAMGSVFCKAGDLVLLGVYADDSDSLSIMQLVDALGLLQPTVSMSVSSLADLGLVERSRDAAGQHTTSVRLAPAGLKRAEELSGIIEDVVVRRKLRKPRD